MSKWTWISNSLELLVCGAFVGYVLLPIVAPHLLGTPTTWVVSIVGGFILFFIIKLTAWIGGRAHD